MQATTTVTEQSKYDASLARLRAHLPKFPVGWRTIMARTILRLAAVRSEARAGICLAPVRSDDGKLYVIAVGRDDRVVDGILRKLVKISGCTCSKCGRPGRAYTVEEITETLCPRCAAPVVLRAELYSWLSSLSWPMENPVYKSDVHPAIRALIPAEKWQSFGPAGSKIESIPSSAVWELKSDFELTARELTD